MAGACKVGFGFGVPISIQGCCIYKVARVLGVYKCLHLAEVHTDVHKDSCGVHSDL